MGLWDTRSFATGFASGLSESFDRADKKRQEAEQARQDFLQKLQLEMLNQIPEIEKNVFAGKSDPAASAAALQQLQTRGAALAPTVPAGSMMDSLVNMFAGAPADTAPAATDLSGLSDLFGKAQVAGEAQRGKETAAKLEFEKQKTQQASDIRLESAKEFEGVRQKNRRELRAKDQASADTAMQKNVNFMSGEFQKTLGLDPKTARIKALELVAGSKAGIGVSDNALFSSVFNPLGGGFNLNDPESRREGMALVNDLKAEMGRQSIVTQGATPAPAQTDPRISGRIEEARKQGISDDRIRADLVESGIDPKSYGF